MDLHFHIHLPASFNDLFRELAGLPKGHHARGADFMLIDDLLQDVQDESTLEDSATTLLTNYHDQAVATAGDPAKLAQIKATIDANKAKIAAALLANTITQDPTAAGGDTNSTAPADGSAPPA